MNRIGRIILTSALVACTALTASCGSGKDEENPANLPNATSTAAKTPDNTESPATPNPAVSEIPAGAEKWINANANAENILMTYDQIQKMNTSIRSKCSALVDIASFSTSMTKSALKTVIEKSSGPSLPKYDAKGKSVTEADLNAIMDNRNLGALADSNNFTKGVTVQRTDIRALPTSVEFYDKSNIQDYDRMQESELAAGSPVWILHTSADGKFYFIQSYYYMGWVDVNNVATAADNADWDVYAKLLNMTENASEGLKFVVVTDSLLKAGNVKLDMGTALLLADEQKSADKYNIILPGKGSDGKLTRVEAEISVKSASIGYLPYNYRNFYIQAFKYVGTPYGWGGMKDGVDCSSYVLSVFKTFGFVFPRNTSQQDDAVGSSTDVNGKSDSAKLSIMKDAAVPVAIYKSGHVMLYLGEMDGTQYIIHAPGGGKVRQDAYDGFSSLIRICEVGPLK